MSALFQPARSQSSFATRADTLAVGGVLVSTRATAVIVRDLALELRERCDDRVSTHATAVIDRDEKLDRVAASVVFQPT